MPNLNVIARPVPSSPAKDDDQIGTTESVAGVQEAGGKDGDEGVEKLENCKHNFCLQRIRIKFFSRFSNSKTDQHLDAEIPESILLVHGQPPNGSDQIFVFWQLSSQQYFRDEPVSHLPREVETNGEGEDIREGDGCVRIVIGTGYQTPAEKVDCDWGEGVEEEWCQFVKTVEHQTVLPDNDGKHQGAHT